MNSAPKRQERFRVFVGGIPYKVARAKLQRVFTVEGRAPEVEIPLGKTGKLKGYAILSFQRARDAEAVLARKEVEIEGRVVSLRKWASNAREMRRDPKQDAFKIYVSNIGEELQEVDLKPVFEAYGAVDYFSLAVDQETGRSKGVGYLKMASQEGFDRVLDCSKIRIGGSEVEVSPNLHNKRTKARKR